MADKEEFSLKTCTATNSRAGGSGVSMGPHGFSEASTGEQTAAKKKARKRRAGRKDSATRTKGGETADQATMTKMAVDEKALDEKAAMPVGADETAEQQQLEQDDEEEEDLDKLVEKAKAEYAQLIDNLFGGDQPKVKWIKYPSYMSYPGMEADMKADGLQFDEEVKR